ncbi:MAG: Pr6Pr family membrane protein [Rhizobacter sp.]
MSTTPTEASRSPASLDSATAVLAFIAWAGVLLQLVLSLQLASSKGQSVAEGLSVYLSYFTVLTNFFVAFALSAVLRKREGQADPLLARPQVLACAAVSIALVGLAYHVLLRHIWNPQGAQWVADMTLHYVTPWLFVIWWLLKAPWPRMRWWSPLLWALYPTAYLAYALLRGLGVGSYPYPFIDAAALGYGHVIVNGLGLLAVFLVVAAVLLGLKHLWMKRRT